MGDSENRRVTIRLMEAGGFVRTEVIDTGPGIPPESLPSLFDLYFRGQRGGANGLGLGLATVKKLAEGHGGRVGVTSGRRARHEGLPAPPASRFTVSRRGPGK
jgi:signal transduction histidine kinase